MQSVKNGLIAGLIAGGSAFLIWKLFIGEPLDSTSFVFGLVVSQMVRLVVDIRIAMRGERG